MAQAPSSTPSLSLSGDPSQTPLVSSETDVPLRGPSNPSAVIAGAVVAAVILATAAAVLFLIIRRRKRAGERPEDTSIEMGTTREEYTKEEYWSPVDEKPLSPDPFMTDAQARSLGLDISRQSTRRIEARFMVVDPPRTKSPPPPRPSSASSKTMAESRSGTPAFDKSLSSREDLDSRHPTPSPLSLEGGNQRTTLTLGAHPPTADLQSAQLQPKMHDLIVQLGLGAARPSTPSKIMRTPHHGHSSDL